MTARSTDVNSTRDNRPFGFTTTSSYSSSTYSVAGRERRCRGAARPLDEAAQRGATGPVGREPRADAEHHRRDGEHHRDLVRVVLHLVDGLGGERVLPVPAVVPGRLGPGRVREVVQRGGEQATADRQDGEEDVLHHRRPVHRSELAFAVDEHRAVVGVRVVRRHRARRQRGQRGVRRRGQWAPWPCASWAWASWPWASWLSVAMSVVERGRRPRTAHTGRRRRPGPRGASCRTPSAPRSTSRVEEHERTTGRRSSSSGAPPARRRGSRPC
jgi:hypothetical protein